jgi:tryptophan-rich sensory protein
MMRALLFAGALCVIGALLEAFFAGKGVRARLEQLRLPPYAVPFWAWMIIGGAYYAICFVVAYRVLLAPASRLRSVALTLLVLVMFINALWNYFFFRSRNLSHAFLLGLPYSGCAVALFLLLLLRIDRTAAACLAPYLIYLLYANIWGYRVWKLNEPDQARSVESR